MTPTAVLCDLDGVVWLAGVALPGSPEAIAELRERGVRVLFVTNNSAARVADQERALANIGIPAAGDVVTSAMASATLVAPGERVLVCGGPGVVEAMQRRGAGPCRHRGLDPGNPAAATATLDAIDVVVVGFHRDFDYEEMAVAASAVRGGARLVATNTDATYPTPTGPIPGGGAIVAAIAVAAGSEPIVAGKPHEPMAHAVADVLGRAPGPMPDVVVVGDRLETDGHFAATLGGAFALVRTGVTAPGAPVAPGVAVRFDTADLSALVRQLGR